MATSSAGQGLATLALLSATWTWRAAPTPPAKGGVGAPSSGASASPTQWSGTTESPNQPSEVGAGGWPPIVFLLVADLVRVLTAVAFRLPPPSHPAADMWGSAAISSSELLPSSSLVTSPVVAPSPPTLASTGPVASSAT